MTGLPLTEAAARRLGEVRGVWYRSWPQGRDYAFTFTLVDEGWRIYIDRQPDYGGRSTGSAATHRLGLPDRPYVCWAVAGSTHLAPIATLSEAQGVAALWADSTENYIASGRFEPCPGRPGVQDRSVINGYPSRRAPAPPAENQPSAPPTRSLWDDIKPQLFG